MVFPGRFSTGCSRCRQRKVKCDEGKPSCRRCYIYGKPCPGYSDQFRFRHTSAQGGAASGNQGQNGHDKTLTSPTTATNGGGKSAKEPPRPGVPQEITFSISTTAPPPEDTGSPIETASNASSSSTFKSLSPASTTSSVTSVSTHLSNAGWRQSTSSRKQQQRRQSRQDEAAAHPMQQLSLASLPLDKIFPKILPQPDLSYDEVSMSYFVSRFVSPDGVDDFPGHLSWLPTLFDHYNHQGPLELATLSVAQMAAFTKFGAEKFKVESLRNHGKAIKALQTAIQDEETAKGDKILGSVLLLCAFNDISGEGLGDPSTHASGLYYLLEKRGFEQLLTRRGLELFLLSLIRLQVYSFLHGDARYCDPGGMGGLLGEWDPLMRAMYFMSRVHVLRNELAQVSLAFMEQMRTESPDAPLPPVPGIPWQGKKPAKGEPEILEPREETELLDDCFNALQDLDQWDVDAQQYWSQNYEMRTCPTLLGNIGKAGNRYDLESACVIVLVRTVRHILLLTLLEHLHRMNILTDNSYGQADSNGVILTSLAEPFAGTLRLTIDDILACVPFALGDVGPDGRPNSSPCDGAGALVILHPLRLVTYSPYATAEQTQAGQNILQRLNQTMGIKAAKPWDESDEMSKMKWAAHYATPRGLAMHLGKDATTATVEYIEGKGGLSTGIDGLTISPESTKS